MLHKLSELIIIVLFLKFIYKTLIYNDNFCKNIKYYFSKLNMKMYQLDTI
jgi:hypothetical protein